MTAHLTGSNLGLELATRINRRALRTGGGRRTGALSTAWDISGNGKLKCQTPKTTELRFTQPLDDYIVGLPPGRARQYVDMTMRCRQCQNCLKLRASDWARRARRELALAERSWFVTITLAPVVHERMMLYAVRRLGRAGVGWDTLSESEKFAERHKSISLELTNAIKRLREYARAPFRLVVVAEAHKSGLPHYHALLHESVPNTLQKRMIQRAFRLGFTTASLVEHDEKASWYVTKYLLKSPLARVRASLDYGSLDRLEAAAACKSEPKQQTHSVPNSALSECAPPAGPTPPRGVPSESMRASHGTSAHDQTPL